MNSNHDETLACRETTEEHREEKEPTSMDTKLEAAQEDEVPAEDATVMPVRELKKKRHRDQKLAAEHRHQKPKTSTQENRRPQKRLAAARSGSSRHGKVTWHTKEIDHKMSCRSTVAQRKRDIVRKNLTQGAGGFPRK
jgi:hypothetical protein